MIEIKLMKCDMSESYDHIAYDCITADDHLGGSKRDTYAEYKSEYVFLTTPALPSLSHSPFL
jgi:hypothetical protein